MPLVNKNIILFVLDAHRDCKNSITNDLFEVNNANFISHILKFNNVKKIIQINARGLRPLSTTDLNSKLLYIIPASKVNKHNMKDLMQKVKEEFSDCAIYLSIDLDVIDPYIYPCVDYPISSGLDIEIIRDLLKLIICSEMKLVGNLITVYL